MSFIDKRQVRGVKRVEQVSGTTLVESLVSLLILSVSLAGGLSMQIGSMQKMRDATFRAYASVVAADIATRIRNNSEGAVFGFYDGKDTGDAQKHSCSNEGCDSADIARLDLYEWGRNVESIAGGFGEITRSGNRFTIKIVWNYSGFDGANEAERNSEYVMQMKI